MKLLVIRRDNIGDLLCTTPLLAALREHFPKTWIGVLANRYNAPILNGNPHIDACFAYEKAKHRAAGRTLFAVWRETAALLFRLRRMRFDWVLCASPGAERFARWIAPRRIVKKPPDASGHEVEITFRLLEALGVSALPGPLVLPSPQCVRTHERSLAVHISARKAAQRWPLEYHADFIRRVLGRGLAERVLLFWAPGAENDPLHPGDDTQAQALVASLAGLPVTPIPTRTLDELIAGLASAGSVVCSDGGAMHIAAALGKPIVCFFGNSSAERWHPWGVSYELLQKPTHNVADISVEEALAAYERLLARL